MEVRELLTTQVVLSLLRCAQHSLDRYCRPYDLCMANPAVQMSIPLVLVMSDQGMGTVDTQTFARDRQTTLYRREVEIVV